MIKRVSWTVSNEVRSFLESSEGQNRPRNGFYEALQFPTDLQRFALGDLSVSLRYKESLVKYEFVYDSPLMTALREQGRRMSVYMHYVKPGLAVDIEVFGQPAKKSIFSFRAVFDSRGRLYTTATPLPD